jgi:hypothetical protein
MMRVLLSALFGLQLSLSYLVTRRPGLWDHAQADKKFIHVLKV